MDEGHWIEVDTGTDEQMKAGDLIPMDTFIEIDSDELIGSEETKHGINSPSSHIFKRCKTPQQDDNMYTDNEALFDIDETKWGDPPSSSLPSHTGGQPWHDRLPWSSSEQDAPLTAESEDRFSLSTSPKNRVKQPRYKTLFKSLSLPNSDTWAEREAFLPANHEQQAENNFSSPPRSQNSVHQQRYGKLSRPWSLQEPEVGSEREGLLTDADRSEDNETSTPARCEKNIKQNKYEHSPGSSFLRDGSLDSYAITSSINRSPGSMRRQDSNVHARFLNDNVLLVHTRTRWTTSAWKKLFAVWCSGCMSHFMCKCSICVCDYSCRDQQGVHCIQRLKKKMLGHLLMVQGLLCLLAVVLSAMVFLPLGNITADFDGQCLLFSSIVLDWISKNHTVSINQDRTKYGEVTECNFTTFLSVVVAIISLFFIWFFIHTKKVSGLEHSETKLQLPVLLFYFALLVAVIVSSFKISIGFSHLCLNIVTNNPYSYVRQRLKCADYENLPWTTQNRSTFYTYMLLAEVSTWLLTVIIILQCCVTALRLKLSAKAAYEEIEIPHERLKEESISSEEELSGRLLEDFSLCLDLAQPPVPTYQVEYKKHQILAKVVVHRDSKNRYGFLRKMDPHAAMVLDAEKLKTSHMKHRGYAGSLKSRNKVKLPLEMAAGRRRKRRNWTGSLDWPGTLGDLNGPPTKRWVTRSFEWHGFETDALFYMPSLQNLEARSFEWPIAGTNFGSQENIRSHEWHGFDSDFGQYRQIDIFPSHEWHGFDSDFSKQNVENMTRSKQERLGSIVQNIRPNHLLLHNAEARESHGKPSIRDIKWPSLDVRENECLSPKNHKSKNEFKGSNFDVRDSQPVKKYEVLNELDFQSWRRDVGSQNLEQLFFHRSHLPDSPQTSLSNQEQNNFKSLPNQSLRRTVSDAYCKKVNVPAKDSSRDNQQDCDSDVSAPDHSNQPTQRFEQSGSSDFQIDKKKLHDNKCAISCNQHQVKHDINKDMNTLWELDQLKSDAEISGYNKDSGVFIPHKMESNSDLRNCNVENKPAARFEWPCSDLEASTEHRISGKREQVNNLNDKFRTNAGSCTKEFNLDSPHQHEWKFAGGATSQSLENLHSVKADEPSISDQATRKCGRSVTIRNQELHGLGNKIQKRSLENVPANIVSCSTPEVSFHRSIDKSEVSGGSQENEQSSSNLELSHAFKEPDVEVIGQEQRSPVSHKALGIDGDLRTRKKKAFRSGIKWQTFDDSEWPVAQVDAHTHNSRTLSYVHGSEGEYSDIWSELPNVAVCQASQNFEWPDSRMDLPAQDPWTTEAAAESVVEIIVNKSDGSGSQETCGNKNV